MALYNLVGGVNVRSIANGKKMTVKIMKQEVLRSEY